MERTVGTITPKNVFSLRGLWVGSPGLGSWVESGVALHVVSVRPHTPEVIRGVRSVGMAEERGSFGQPWGLSSGRGTLTSCGYTPNDYFEFQ